jgi:hypothetical protein
MILLTPDLRFALRANAITACAAEREARVLDHVPVVKFFNPIGAATWVATELYTDGDTLFGLADLGFGCPEIGTFSLREIEGVHLPFCLAIERDLCFATSHPLSRWAQAARETGSIIAAEQLLRAPPEGGRTELPPSS